MRMRHGVRTMPTPKVGPSGLGPARIGPARIGLSVLGLLAFGPLVGACGTSRADDGKFAPQADPVQPPVATGPQPAPSASSTVRVPPPAADSRPSVPIGKPGSWRVTTYYTAVESLHGGAMTAVKGCTSVRCSNGTTPLGSYPADFLRVIRTEGSGRITSGPQKGRFLNWSHSTGYWLDDSTRDPAGRPLKAWQSAAADKDVLARGQIFVITDCGAGVPDAVCKRFRQARWKVTDLFRPGYGGQRHADLYLGEETGAGFARYSTTLNGASLGGLSKEARQ